MRSRIQVRKLPFPDWGFEPWQPLRRIPIFFSTRYPEGSSTLNRYFVFRRADGFITEIFPGPDLLPEGISDSGTVFFSNSPSSGASCRTRNTSGFSIQKIDLDGTKAEVYQAADGAQLQGFFLSSRGIFLTIATGRYEQVGGRNPYCSFQGQQTKVYQRDSDTGSLREINGLGGSGIAFYFISRVAPK